MDALYERACQSTKYWDPTGLLRKTKNILEETHERSKRGAQFVLLSGYKTASGKLTVEAFGVGRGGESYSKQEGAARDWREYVEDFLLGTVDVGTPSPLEAMPQGAPGAEKSARDTSVATLGDMLCKLGMEQYRDVFCQERVSIETVERSSLNQLKSNLHMSYGDAVELKHAVSVFLGRAD